MSAGCKTQAKLGKRFVLSSAKLGCHCRSSLGFNKEIPTVCSPGFNHEQGGITHTSDTSGQPVLCLSSGSQWEASVIVFLDLCDT